MLKKDSFIWTPHAMAAFYKLKETVTTGPVLSLTDIAQKFVLECDAFTKDIGAVLMQRGKPIAYFSQALHGRNQLLSTYEKELLALVLSVQKWKQYLLGHPIVVKTDHSS